MGIISSDIHASTPQTTKPLPKTLPKEDPVYIYKQRWKSIHNKYKACQSKCKHTKEHQNEQNSSNEVEDLMLKGLQIIKPPFWQFPSKFLGQSFLLSLH
jgi:hypothetical protein